MNDNITPPESAPTDLELVDQAEHAHLGIEEGFDYDLFVKSFFALLGAEFSNRKGFVTASQDNLRTGITNAIGGAIMAESMLRPYKIAAAPHRLPKAVRIAQAQASKR